MDDKFQATQSGTTSTHSTQPTVNTPVLAPEQIPISVSSPEKKKNIKVWISIILVIVALSIGAVILLGKTGLYKGEFPKLDESEAKADLLVTSINARADLATIVEGVSVGIRGDLKNKGTADAGSFTASFTVDENIIDKKTINSLEAGKTTIVDFSFTTTAGDHLLSICLDRPLNTVAESDEGNNCNTKNVSVAAAAPSQEEQKEREKAVEPQPTEDTAFRSACVDAGGKFQADTCTYNEIEYKEQAQLAAAVAGVERAVAEEQRQQDQRAREDNQVFQTLCEGNRGIFKDDTCIRNDISYKSREELQVALDAAARQEEPSAFEQTCRATPNAAWGDNSCLFHNRRFVDAESLRAEANAVERGFESGEAFTAFLMYCTQTVQGRPENNSTSCLFNGQLYTTLAALQQAKAEADLLAVAPPAADVAAPLPPAEEIAFFPSRAHESTLELCTDGEDNDLDGSTDLGDGDCFTFRDLINQRSASEILNTQTDTATSSSQSELAPATVTMNSPTVECGDPSFTFDAQRNVCVPPTLVAVQELQGKQPRAQEQSISVSAAEAAEGQLRGPAISNAASTANAASIERSVAASNASGRRIATAAQASAVHGAYIQGQTGPGMLAAGLTSLFAALYRRKKNRH